MTGTVQNPQQQIYIMTAAAKINDGSRSMRTINISPRWSPKMTCRSFHLVGVAADGCHLRTLSRAAIEEVTTRAADWRNWLQRGLDGTRVAFLDARQQLRNLRRQPRRISRLKAHTTNQRSNISTWSPSGTDPRSAWDLSGFPNKIYVTSADGGSAAQRITTSVLATARPGRPLKLACASRNGPGFDIHPRHGHRARRWR